MTAIDISAETTESPIFSASLLRMRSDRSCVLSKDRPELKLINTNYDAAGRTIPVFSDNEAHELNITSTGRISWTNHVFPAPPLISYRTSARKVFISFSFGVSLTASVSQSARIRFAISPTSISQLPPRIRRLYTASNLPSMARERCPASSSYLAPN